MSRNYRYPAPRPRERAEKRNTDNFRYISLFTFVLSVISFLVTTFLNEKWKSAEFFDKKYKDFASDQDNRIIRKLLFYQRNSLLIGNRLFTLGPNQLNEVLQGDTAYYNDENEQSQRFDSIRIVLRERLHDYFDNLNTFHTYYEDGNANKDQLKNYLAYDLRAIADTSFTFKTPSTRYYLWLFINQYGYSGINELCKICDLPEIPKNDTLLTNLLNTATEKEFPDY